jgi:hypothetical protein
VYPGASLSKHFYSGYLSKDIFATNADAKNTSGIN